MGRVHRVQHVRSVRHERDLVVSPPPPFGCSCSVRFGSFVVLFRFVWYCFGREGRERGKGASDGGRGREGGRGEMPREKQVANEESYGREAFYLVRIVREVQIKCCFEV